MNVALNKSHDKINLMYLALRWVLVKNMLECVLHFSGCYRFVIGGHFWWPQGDCPWRNHFYTTGLICVAQWTDSTIHFHRVRALIGPLTHKRRLRLNSHRCSHRSKFIAIAENEGNRRKEHKLLFGMHLETFSSWLSWLLNTFFNQSERTIQIHSELLFWHITSLLLVEFKHTGNFSSTNCTNFLVLRCVRNDAT